MSSLYGYRSNSRGMSAPVNTAYWAINLMFNIGLRLTAIYAVLGVVVRLCMIFMPITDLSGVNFFTLLSALVLGVIADVATAMVMLLPLMAYGLSCGQWRFERKQCYVGIVLLVGLLAWLIFGARQLVEFNRGLHRVLVWLAVYWLATYVLRTFLPSIRRLWAQIWMGIGIGIYLLLMVFNACGEWLFWNEFGVRYNFIAVDYLIYTNEVVGNICQSYPVGIITAGMVAVTVILEWLFFRRIVVASGDLDRSRWRIPFAAVYIPVVVLSVGIIAGLHSFKLSDNVFAAELPASGPYKFLQAFTNNRLDYKDFYLTYPAAEVEAQIAPELTGSHGNRIDSSVIISADSTATSLTPNIVLITMESVSGDYMARFGGKKQLTPTLDSLYHHSLAFDRMFAAGNRTVRGLEALTLSRPPSPGESIIKRPDNTGYPSVADIMRDRGYSLSFLYGGDSYFDNMESFFSGLGYEIVDKDDIDPATITCQTVWGICDGDVYNKLIEVADKGHASGRPFHIHMMTTSNHRPYIYPDGKISIPPSEKRRDGGVMYSDYALGEFLDVAADKEWFDNTVFIIVADHCASSAGAVDLPLANYHIPAVIYAPALVRDTIVDKTASQIDIMPTLLSAIGWDYDTPLYGSNILSDAYRGRAFVATYQDMGYLEGDTLTVLSPGSKYSQYVLSPDATDPYRTLPASTESEAALKRAALYYQSAE